MGKSEFGEFLQARRAEVSPSAVGLTDNGERRRVRGLRREEVAALVVLSTDYYVRLEQGRGGRPSESVLESIAVALMLDNAQREHLNHLAHPPHRRPRVKRERVAKSTSIFLDTLTVPALLIDGNTQVLESNVLARELFTDFTNRTARERHTAWLLFRDEDVAARHRNWNSAASRHRRHAADGGGKKPR
jgi:transcriptional regulator with XRE-family HTH domain